MRIQKIYKWYCYVTWTLWLVTLGLIFLSGSAYDVRNLALAQFTVSFSRIPVIISIIPVHPILCIAAMENSVRAGKGSEAVMNLVRLVVSTVLAFFLLAYYAWLTGA